MEAKEDDAPQGVKDQLKAKVIECRFHPFMI